MTSWGEWACIGAAFKFKEKTAAIRKKQKDGIRLPLVFNQFNGISSLFRKAVGACSSINEEINLASDTVWHFI
jgi:hypothetical protein